MILVGSGTSGMGGRFFVEALRDLADPGIFSDVVAMVSFRAIEPASFTSPHVCTLMFYYFGWQASPSDTL